MMKIKVEERLLSFRLERSVMEKSAFITLHHKQIPRLRYAALGMTKLDGLSTLRVKENDFEAMNNLVGGSSGES